MVIMTLPTRLRHGLAAVTVCVAFLLSGCNHIENVVGYLQSVGENSATLRMTDGSTRTFLVRPEHAEVLDLPHLKSHEGVTDIGFRARYETVDGQDYLLAATEVAPPR
jgi:hypothetical protein